MSFRRYPKYKDSGVEWLGQVPAHWEVLALKHVIEMRSGEGITSELISDEGDYPVFGGNGLRGHTTQFTHNGTYALVGRQGALCGNVNYATGKFWASEHAVVCLPRRPVATRWLGELLRAMNLGQYSVAAAQPGLSVDLVSRIKIPVPPASERDAIAAFVEPETAKIDALVAEQERLIELLKEKRQAVISHAVTKGLNRDAPMKDSGIEWLGKVPAHWHLNRIKHLAVSIEQGWSPQCDGYPAEVDAEWGVLKVGCVNGGKFNPLENKLLPPDLEPIPALSIREGDMMVSRANTRELVGSAAVARRDYPTLMLCDKLYRIRFSADMCCPDFVCIYLACRAARNQIELEATGASASMLNIGQAAIMDLMIAVPPVQEQRDIVAQIERETSQLDSLTTEAGRAINLLQERRAALISAAVTGQIDVRSAAERSAA